MNLAFSNIAWTADDDAVVMSDLKLQGFTGLEVAPTRIWPEPLNTPAHLVNTFRQQVLDAGLEIIAMQSMLYGHPELKLFEDATSRLGLVDHLRGMIDLAQSLGATRLVFGSPGNRQRGPMSMAEAWSTAIDTFTELGAAASQAGVCFCVEANPVHYGCDFLVDAVESTAFVRDVDSPGVRLHLDAACMALAGDDVTERVRVGADVLAHVHASAPNLGVVQADNAVGHAELASALRDSAYAGFVSVEMRATPIAVPTVRQSAEFVSGVYG